ncbi:protein of unknown function [Burkholderia multivorans]
MSARRRHAAVTVLYDSAGLAKPDIRFAGPAHITWGPKTLNMCRQIGENSGRCALPGRVQFNPAGSIRRWPLLTDFRKVLIP